MSLSVLANCVDIVEPMFEFKSDTSASRDFQSAVETLRLAALRPELSIEQIAAPGQIAKHSIAFSATILAGSKQGGDLGTGRFILLHEDVDNQQWQGRFRIVCYAKSPLETDIGADELISDVAWSWLQDALEQRGANFVAEAGTATRIISTGFGTLSHQSDHAELEMRASWSPQDATFAPHFEAWQDLICMMAGYPSLPPGVTQLNPNA